jgi:hypothetical protein
MMADDWAGSIARNLVTAAGAVVFIADSVAAALPSAVAVETEDAAGRASAPSDPWVLSNTS